MRYFCTYFDRNYLIKGLSLIRSLNRSHGDSYRIFVVCMDELTRVILEKLQIPGVICVPFHTIEQNDGRLLSCRSDRSHVEYLWTSTPTIILRIIERFPEVDILTYVDADMFFYNSVDLLFEEIGDASVMIHEHRFPPYLAHLSIHGRFNVGLLVFRRNAVGISVLQWWRERCLEWCKSTVEGDKFGDQKYLDCWPEIFDGVHVIKNIGVGTAPWNHSQYRFDRKDETTYVNDTPLVVYHFHAFQILNEAVVVPIGFTAYHNPLSYYRSVLLDYLEELDRTKDVVRSILPEFQFGLQKNDFQLTTDCAFVVRNKAFPYLTDIGLPNQRIELSPQWTLFPGAVTLP